MTRANANALFQGLKSRPSYNKEIHIRPGDQEDKNLRKARAKIRSELRSAFQRIKPYLEQDALRKVLLANRSDQFNQVSKKVTSIDIRFLTQGSHAYGTLIRPAQPKFQEIDLDDGVYVPIPFVDGRPIFSSEGLFEIIQRALTPLVTRENWSFQRKNTCIRIQLSGQNAHIDLPLFAVETNNFNLLVNKFQTLTGKTLRKTKNLNLVFDNAAKNLRLEQGNIVLADRNTDWQPSDPKALHDWFIEKVEINGPVLKRCCRYMKGWKDETWRDCELKSIALMIACVDILKELGAKPSEDRDDLIMLRVAEALPNRIRKGNLTWHNDLPPVDEKWSPEEKEEFAREAEKLADKLHSALENCFYPEIIIKHLKDAFGDRFPNAPEAVSFLSADQTTEVLETKAATVAMPLVGTSVSA